MLSLNEQLNIQLQVIQIQYNDKYNSLSTEYQSLLSKYEEKEKENEGKLLVPCNEYNELKVYSNIYN